ncbi:helix-turn-helix domain-containing protein [Streptomyces sp. NBC_00024]|uniref:helix-turn-helix domain-containing protein n=1 Tax=Streptomyces sp. NBC_00024 TaxID=2903612 RepID=UPI00324E828D
MTGNYRPRADVAVLLRQGATYREIQQQLGACGHAISATRKAYRIPVPPGRRLDPDRRVQVEQQVAKLLLQGATYQQIRDRVGVSQPTIVRIRRSWNIPVTVREPRPARTVEQALALYAQPYGDGHVRWAGPHAGRMPVLYAKSRFNARHVTFRAHHGRDPVGYVLGGCTEPGCMAGAHLTDEPIRSGKTLARSGDQ